MFLKISQISQENTCTRVSFLIKLKRLWHRCFLVNFTKFLTTPFFIEHLWCLLLLIMAICTIYCKSFAYFSGKKRVKSKDMQFFLQNVQNKVFKIFKMFENNMKFTRAACWTDSKISNRDKDTTVIIFLFCHFCCSLLWCNYWKSFKSDSYHQRMLLYLVQWKPFKNDEKCFLLQIKNCPCSQDI